jgi:hypothetical protein
MIRFLPLLVYFVILGLIMSHLEDHPSFEGPP